MDKYKFLIETEESVLGQMILEPLSLVEVKDILSEDCFYKADHNKIFNCILALEDEGKAIDILTVTNQVKKKYGFSDTLNPYFVSTLTNRVASGVNIVAHAQIVVQEYFRRLLKQHAQRVLQVSEDDSKDVFNLITGAIDRFESILNKISTNNAKTAFELTRTVLRSIESAKQSNTTITGVPTGFNDLDKITGGWQSGDLIILAARPSMGKTALAVQMAVNAVKNGKSAYLSSLEMPADKIQTRIIASELKINTKSLTKNAAVVDFERINDGLRRNPVLESEDLIIDDSSDLTVAELVAKAKKIHQNLKKKNGKGLDIIVIDYLQLLRGSSKNIVREQEISEISRRLKVAAKELKIPIVALSQLSRAVENRADKRPRLADLRESGAIEQDADIVMFLMREEYYGITENEHGMDTKGVAIIDIAKNRNGSTGDFNLKYLADYTRFENYETQTYLTELIDSEDNDEPF